MGGILEALDEGKVILGGILETRSEEPRREDTRREDSRREAPDSREVKKARR